MAVSYQVTIDIKQDGSRMPGFPLTKTMSVTESKGKAVIQRADADDTFTELPLQELTSIEVLYVTANEAFNLRINDQSDSHIPMDADGVLLLIGANIPSGASNKVALENESGSTAEVTIVAGGS